MRTVAVTLMQEGYTYGEIAKLIGGNASASGVSKLVKRLQERGTVVTKSGRSRTCAPPYHNSKGMLYRRLETLEVLSFTETTMNVRLPIIFKIESSFYYSTVSVPSHRISS